MGLARRGSRPITVDGANYRWTISPDSGFMVLVVEEANGLGQRLEAQLSYSETGGEPAAITPRVVRRTIELALLDGWRPDQSGRSPFRLADADDRVFGDEQ